MRWCAVMKRGALLLLIAALVAAFFAFDLQQYLTLETLQGKRDEFIALKEQSPWLVTGIAFIGYVLVAALSLPGALVMTLAMGALFGLLWGTLLVSFASSIGATLAFLA